MTSKPASAKTSSRPSKKHEESEKLEWTLTVPMPKKYKVSKRTNNLAKPIRRDVAHLTKQFPTEIPRGVLKHRATKRILELSEPKHVANPFPLNVKANPFVVSPGALKYKASKRTKELAEAREYVNNHTRDDPFGISPAALIAKPKQRIIELAKPKNIHFLPSIF
uniref:Testicular haploid expressed gene protein-like n=1 Tax=Glossina morsitans morsitans TaxID=37546 RepID=A0A1B0FKY5_GLOMM